MTIITIAMSMTAAITTTDHTIPGQAIPITIMKTYEREGGYTTGVHYTKKMKNESLPELISPCDTEFLQNGRQV